MDPNHLPPGDSSLYHDALEQCVDHWGFVPEKTALVRDGVSHVFATEFTAAFHSKENNISANTRGLVNMASWPVSITNVGQ